MISTVPTPFNTLLRTTCAPGNPYYDSLGSLGVGTLLGSVSAFLIYTNTEALLGRSIQAERVQKLTEFLENDPAVRSANHSMFQASDLAVVPQRLLIGPVVLSGCFSSEAEQHYFSVEISCIHLPPVVKRVFL